MAGEALVVPNVAAVVVPDERCAEVLLQRRDKPGEVVRGRLELPSGRWRAGETAEEAVRREVVEETGLEVEAVLAPSALRVHADPSRPFEVVFPAAVSVGVAGAYPALHLAFVCVARGRPVARPGESADPRWYPVDEVRRLLEDPARFTGPALAILTAFLASDGPDGSRSAPS
jgi:8-oxo-dGTP pyrophosphatase MutT (NUDIX family)